MQPDSPKHLEDIRDAAEFVLRVAEERTFDQYLEDRLARQAVERNFEIIGEALKRLSRADPATACRITEVPRVIAFRNTSRMLTTASTTRSSGDLSDPTSRGFWARWRLS